MMFLFLKEWNKEKIVLGDGDILEVPELLPGWQFPVVDVWARLNRIGGKGGHSLFLCPPWQSPKIYYNTLKYLGAKNKRFLIGGKKDDSSS